MRAHLMLAGVLMLGACGDGTTTLSFTDSKGKTVTAKASDDNSESMVSIGGEEGGEVRIGNDEAPENLPEHVPAYENATYTGSLLANPAREGPGGGMMSFLTPDPPSKVIEFYQRKAIVAGLRETLTGKTGDGDALSATAADGRTMQLTARAGADGKTAVEIVWADASMAAPVVEPSRQDP
jgi:hypothetical protein